MGLFGPPNVEKLKAKKDVNGLIKALSYQKDPSVNQAAAKALGQIGDARAIEPLIVALNNRNRLVIQAVATALVWFGAPAVKPLVSAIKTARQHDPIFQIAPQILAQIRDRRAVEPLINALKDSYLVVQQASAQALGQIGDPRAVKPLVTTLHDQNRDVRRASASALQTLGWRPDQDSVGATYWIIKDQWQKCIQIGVPAIEPLATALRNGFSHEREAAASTLGQIRNARAVDPLIAALKDESMEVRRAATEALEQIGSLAVEPLIMAIANGGSDARHVINVLGQIGGAHATEVLVDTLSHEDWQVRQAATGALGEIGDTRAIEPLLTLLNNGTYSERESAVNALDKLDWQPDQGVAGATYWVTKKEWERCAPIGLPAVEPLIAALNQGNWIQRDAIAGVLGQIGDARAVEPLSAMLTCDNRDLRQTAARALVALYQSGRIEEEHQRLILAQRSTITERHGDQTTRTGRSSDCTHQHTDSGIGVEFPV